jgi:hypothetical protein
MIDPKILPSSLSNSLVSFSFPSGLSPRPLASDCRLDLPDSDNESIPPDSRPMTIVEMVDRVDLGGC